MRLACWIGSHHIFCSSNSIPIVILFIHWINAFKRKKTYILWTNQMPSLRNKFLHWNNLTWILFFKQWVNVGGTYSIQPYTDGPTWAHFALMALGQRKIQRWANEIINVGLLFYRYTKDVCLLGAILFGAFPCFSKCSRNFC